MTMAMTMAMTGKTARAKALALRVELERMSKELATVVAELPLPSPEEFEAMRSRKIPWTPEAWYAALLRDADLLVSQARDRIDDDSNQTAKSLKSLFERQAAAPPPLESSLRFLVQERSGVRIPPSEAEIRHYDPWAHTKITFRTLLSSLTELCAPIFEPFDAAEEAALRAEPALKGDEG